MKIRQVLEMFSHRLCALPMGGRKSDAALAALDRGVLQIGLMLSALDGQIFDEEYTAFRLMLDHSRNATEKAKHECLHSALAQAGYFLAAAQCGVLEPEKRLKMFLSQAESLLQKGFADGTLADLRRAFALWTILAMSDGDYSDIERQAVAGLYERFACVRRAGKRGKTELLEEGYLASVEEIVRGSLSSRQREESVATFERLITTVGVVTKETGEKLVVASSTVPLRTFATAACTLVLALPLLARPSSGKISATYFNGRGGCEVLAQATTNARTPQVYVQSENSTSRGALTTSRDGTGHVVRSVEQRGDTTVERDGKGRVISTSTRNADGSTTVRDGTGRVCSTTVSR